MENKQVF